MGVLNGALQAGWAVRGAAMRRALNFKRALLFCYQAGAAAQEEMCVNDTGAAAMLSCRGPQGGRPGGRQAGAQGKHLGGPVGAAGGCASSLTSGLPCWPEVLAAAARPGPVPGARAPWRARPAGPGSDGRQCRAGDALARPPGGPRPCRPACCARPPRFAGLARCRSPAIVQAQGTALAGQETVRLAGRAPPLAAAAAAAAARWPGCAGAAQPGMTAPPDCGSAASCCCAAAGAARALLPARPWLPAPAPAPQPAAPRKKTRPSRSCRRPRGTSWQRYPRLSSSRGPAG